MNRMGLDGIVHKRNVDEWPSVVIAGMSVPSYI